MEQIRYYSTGSVAPAFRPQYWDRIIAENFAGGSVAARREKFGAEFWRWPMQGFGMVRARSHRSLVTRWRDERPRDPDGAGIMIHLQNTGFSRTRQDDRSALVSAGEMAVCNSISPYDVDISDSNDMLVLEIPLSALRHIEPEALASCRKIGRLAPAVTILRQYILSIWHEYSGVVEEEDRELHSEIILRLISHALRSQNAGLSSRDLARADRIVAWIEAHLFVPELSSSMIADNNNCSARTVQALFAQMGTTPREFITKRRLERAKDMLEVPSTAGMTITEIAFLVGFNDSSYFSRAFRQKFGMTPRAAKK
jgi:AraC-like DNA-binding protein